MSTVVHSINVLKAEEEVSKCNKIVKDYVKALKNSSNGWKECTQKAIRKIKELDKQILKGEINDTNKENRTSI